MAHDTTPSAEIVHTRSLVVATETGLRKFVFRAKRPHGNTAEPSIFKNRALSVCVTSIKSHTAPVNTRPR